METTLLLKIPRGKKSWQLISYIFQYIFSTKWPVHITILHNQDTVEDLLTDAQKSKNGCNKKQKKTGGPGYLD